MRTQIETKKVSSEKFFFLNGLLNSDKNFEKGKLTSAPASTFYANGRFFNSPPPPPPRLFLLLLVPLRIVFSVQGKSFSELRPKQIRGCVGHCRLVLAVVVVDVVVVVVDVIVVVVVVVAAVAASI